MGPQGGQVQCQHHRIKEDGHCTIRCTVKGLDSELFCLDLGTPDRLTAELVKKQFILKGNEIYQMLINTLTEEEK